MRLRTFELRAFGPFTDTKLQLGEARPVVHLIYGPNEAGKSTALRAVHDFFYGIEERSPDAHLHKLADLCLAGLACDARGRELYVVRRKKRKDTLFDAAGNPLPGAEASWLTAGVPEPHFRSFFGLSYANLEHDSKALLSGAGDLGESLFGAGLGGRAVHDVLASLTAEAERIYKPRGSTQALHLEIARHAEAKAKVREDAVDASAFDKQQQAVAEAIKRDQDLRLDRNRKLDERAKLERARRVLPLFAERTRLERERRALGDVRLLHADAARKRAALEEALRIEASLLAQHELEIARLERERRELDVPEQLLALDPDAIEDLRDRLASFRQTLLELPERRAALARAREVEAGTTRELGARALTGRSHDALARSLREHALLQGGLLGEVANVERELARRLSARAERVAQEAAQLPAFAGKASSLVPTAQTCAVFHERFAAGDRAARAHADALAALSERRERTERDLDALDRSGTVPAEEDLVRARSQRSEWLERLRGLPSDDAKLAAARFATQGDGAHALTELGRTIAESDSVADRLRREATRVAERAQLVAERESCLRTRARLESEGAELARARAELARSWREVWATLGIEVTQPGRAAFAPRCSPRELQLQVEDFHARRSALAALEVEIAELRADAAAQLEKLEAWRTTWAELVERIGLPRNASAGDVEAQLGAIKEQRARVAEREAAQRALADAERELSAFESDVRKLAVEHLGSQAETSAAEAAALLVRRYERARADHDNRQKLDKELRKRRAEREEAELRRAVAHGQVTELLAEAEVDDVDALRGAEQASDRARSLDAELEKVREALTAACEGVELSVVELEVRELSVDSARVRWEELRSELEEQDEEIRSAAQELASQREGLKRFQLRHGAADAAATAAEHTTAIKALGERYVRLQLAAALLKHEIARYRDRHQAPLLRSASALFARLTCGGFRGLETDYDSADEPLLVCVRDDGKHGERVPLSGLSAATRDQLFLALRLASLGELAATQELLPLVLDDVLVHFDDARVAAALSVLGDTAALTQVLFFTHHSRVVELARATLPAERLVVHELAAPGARRARTVA